MAQTHPPRPPHDERSTIASLHIWQFQAVRDVLFILAVIALVWLGYAMRAVTVPLLIALLLAYLIEPVVSRLSAHPRLSRPIVVGGLMATGGIILALILTIVTIAVVNQGTRLIADIRSGRFEQRAERIIEFIPAEHRESIEALYRDLFSKDELAPQPEVDDEAGAQGEADAGSQPPLTSDSQSAEPTADSRQPRAALDDDERIRQLIREEIAVAANGDSSLAPVRGWWQIIAGGAGQILNILGGAIAFGFLLFLIPFYLFFFSVAYPAIAEFGRGLIPEASRPRAFELLSKMDRVIAGFVRGRIIVSLLMGVGFAIGWWIIGVPYAILLGFIIGLFCAVPFLGIIGVPLAVGLLFAQQIELPADERMAWWAIILWPTLVFVIVQTIESYALTPMIAGKATNLDPVTIIVAVLAGGSIMGVYGMLLAIPIAACLKILITDVLLPRVRAWTRGEAKDPLPIE